MRGLLLGLLGGLTLKVAAFELRWADGGALYPCNAGISRLAAAEASLGSDRLNATVEEAREADRPPASYAVEFSAQKPGRSEALHARNRDPFATKLRNLRYAFSSESYGSAYFAEFCYIAPAKAPPPSSSVLLVDASGPAGVREAGLTFAASWSCDFEAPWKGERVRTPFRGDAYGASEPAPFSSGGLSLDFTLSRDPNRIPTACRVRLDFAENAFRIERKNEMGGAEMTIHVAIDSL